jgi:hypothetical protein
MQNYKRLLILKSLAKEHYLTLSRIFINSVFDMSFFYWDLEDIKDIREHFIG